MKLERPLRRKSVRRRQIRHSLVHGVFLVRGYIRFRLLIAQSAAFVMGGMGESHTAVKQPSYKEWLVKLVLNWQAP